MEGTQAQQQLDNSGIDLGSLEAQQILESVAGAVMDDAASDNVQPPVQPADQGGAAATGQGALSTEQMAQVMGMMSAMQQQIAQLQEQLNSQRPTRTPDVSDQPTRSQQEWQELFAEKPEEAVKEIIKMANSPLNGKISQLETTIFNMAELSQFLMTHPDIHTPEMRQKMNEAIKRIPGANTMRPGQLMSVAYELAKAATPAAPTQITVADVINNPALMEGLVKDEKARQQLAKAIIEAQKTAPTVVDNAPGKQPPAGGVPNMPRTIREGTRLLKSGGLLDKIFGNG